MQQRFTVFEKTPTLGKSLCKQCRGSGFLYRPQHVGNVRKHVFVRCASCSGHGVRRSLSQEKPVET